MTTVKSRWWGKIHFDALSKDAFGYLQNAGACFGNPIDRLMHMNQPAVEFYKENGIDLSRERLEIALCAQHNNGGLAINCWWETNIKGFFAVGEVSASHGVYRPGGSALNSGQVGSMRAARYIAARRLGKPSSLDQFMQTVLPQIEPLLKCSLRILGRGEDNTRLIWKQAAVRMSLYGAAIRNSADIEYAIEETKKELDGFWDLARAQAPKRLPLALRVYDMLICQYVYLSAMKNYIENGGESRGSALYSGKKGMHPHSLLAETYGFQLDDGALGNLVQEVQYRGEACRFNWRHVRPIPRGDDFFENVWRSFRENENIDEEA